MAQRLIQEVRRREKVIRIFPNKAPAWRLVGALLAEKHEEWSTGRRYWTMDKFYQWREKQTSNNTEYLHPESSNHTPQPA
ncbi:transposase-like protein [Salinibacter ruber]|nr:transposase-like protein [Salinibacter ruber]